MKTSLATEPCALELRACGPQADDVAEITWNDLRNAPVGSTWSVAAGGSLYSESRSATLVFRDEDCAVLLVTREYRQDGEQEQIDREVRVFTFAD